MTHTEVADTLEAFINDQGGQWDWDDYISATIFSDPYLQEVQARMVHLSDEFPAEKGRGYCSPEGIDVIRGYIEDLRKLAAATKALG
ncbi:MAG TPA: hypothetical protein VK608_17675 [Edaphobacter sp.]|nr:hypothetical protein [Edaphobacter sp.]